MSTSGSAGRGCSFPRISPGTRGAAAAPRVTRKPPGHAEAPRVTPKPPGHAEAPGVTLKPPGHADALARSVSLGGRLGEHGGKRALMAMSWLCVRDRFSLSRSYRPVVLISLNLAPSRSLTLKFYFRARVPRDKNIVSNGLSAA